MNRKPNIYFFLIIIIFFSFKLILFSHNYFEEDEIYRILETITVQTASKRAQSITEAPATIYVITEQEIKLHGFVDLKDIIKIIPGMIVEDMSYGQLYGGQRGFNGVFQKTLLMLNGREVNNILANEAFIGPQFPLHNVKIIEIIAGPGSALYGANAFAGIINIITKDAFDIDGTEISYLTGKNNTTLLTFNFGNIFENSELVISGRYKISDGWDFSDYVSNVERFGAGVFNEDNGWIRTPQGLMFNKNTGQVFRTPNTHNDRYENNEDAKYIDFNYSVNIENNNLFLPDDFYFGGNIYQMTTNHGMSKIQWLNHTGYDHREQYLYYAGLNKRINRNLDLNFEFRYTNEYTWGNHTSADVIRNWDSSLPDYEQDGNAYGRIVNGEWKDWEPVSNDDTSVPYTPTKHEIERMRGWWSNKLSSGAKRYFAELQINYQYRLQNREHNLVSGLVYDRKNAITTPWSLAYPSGEWGGVNFDMHPEVPDFDKRNALRNTKYAFYIQDQSSFFNNHYLLTLGIRADYHQNDSNDKSKSHGMIFNPRIGLIYKHTYDDTLKFLYGTAFREPAPFEEPDEGMDSLSPEKMRTIEIGYNRRNRQYDYQNSLNLYYNQAKDILMNQYQIKDDGRALYGYTNGVRANVFGLENVFQYEPSSNFYFQLNYVYQNPKIQMDGFNIVDSETVPVKKTFSINNIPRHQIVLLSRITLNNNFKIGWTSRWVDKITTYKDRMPYLDPTYTGNNSNPIEKIDSYMIHDINFLITNVFSRNYGNDNSRIDINFTVFNLFDKDYENPNNRTERGNMENPNVAGQPGRTYYLKINGYF